MKIEKEKNLKNLSNAVWMMAAFILWTVAIRLIDVKALGPQGSAVGFAAINQAFHNLTGVHMELYIITDWLSLVPFGFMIGFAFLGLTQWIQRKDVLKVDFSILVLGGFYVVVMAAYLLFEILVINYRPVLINGILEPSYPSSTTMLVMCVMPTAVMQLKTRIKNVVHKRIIITLIIVYNVFMIFGRLISGVHWLTDIIGGALLSASLVLMYRAIIPLKTP